MRGRRGKSFSKTSCNMETRHVRLAHPVSYRVLYGAAYYFPSLIITMFASSLSSESASLAHTTKSTRRRGAARLGATRLVFASNSTFVICITDRCLAAFVRWFGRSVAVAGDLEREPHTHRRRSHFRVITTWPEDFSPCLTFVKRIKIWGTTDHGLGTTEERIGWPRVSL